MNMPKLSNPEKAERSGRKRGRARPQLGAVFDTSVLYNGSASDLVRQEIAAADLYRRCTADTTLRTYRARLVQRGENTPG